MFDAELDGFCPVSAVVAALAAVIVPVSNGALAGVNKDKSDFAQAISIAHWYAWKDDAMIMLVCLVTGVGSVKNVPQNRVELGPQ